MEVNASRKPGQYRWKYASPNLSIPLVKMSIPHSRWMLKIDEETCTPVLDKAGKYLYSKTGGLEASIADCVQAVKGQGVRMLHIVDAIEATNIAHTGSASKPVQEGFVFAGNDMVAVDACAARYLFTMVPLYEVDRICKEYGLTSDVIQKVPMPVLEGKNIITGEVFDSPFSRCGAMKYYEDRGLGQSGYYIVGNDLWQGGKLASLQQHLGRVDNGAFQELMTSTMYNTAQKPLWYLQAMCLAYLELNDKLTGSDFKQQILEVFDENGDGVIDYTETGRGNVPIIMAYELTLMMQNLDPLEAFRFRFLLSTTQLKNQRKEWNPDGHCVGEDTVLAQSLVTAFNLSKAEKKVNDPLFPGMKAGKGMWPSMQYAIHRHILSRIYGQEFPERIDLMSPYGAAFSYADARWHSGKYGRSRDAIGGYHQAAFTGAEMLPFTFYVPRGFGKIGVSGIPNVEETDDFSLIFTVSFTDNEAWKDLRISSFNLK